MSRGKLTGGLSRMARKLLVCSAAACLAATLIGSVGLAARQPSTGSHVPELGDYLDHAQIAKPAVYRRLAVYPVLLKDHAKLRGGWLTLDDAISRGVLVVTEKGAGGSVPVVVIENRSRDRHVFIMAGEVLSGGKQTRTARRDVVLAPGQRIELSVFCVEAHRWQGGERFSAANMLLPQSIQKELRKGADQQRVWSEVARNNRALAAENAAGSLELALKTKPVRDNLTRVRQSIVPQMPEGTVGFIFVDRGRALGAEFFGRDDLARTLLPKLLDSYAVDCVLLPRSGSQPEQEPGHRAAIELFERIRRTGSERTGTPGSGAGIRTRRGGLLGDGVSLGGSVVHYGVQVQDRIVPHPKPYRAVPPQPPNDLPRRSWR